MDVIEDILETETVWEKPGNWGFITSEWEGGDEG